MDRNVLTGFEQHRHRIIGDHDSLDQPPDQLLIEFSDLLTLGVDEFEQIPNCMGIPLFVRTIGFTSRLLSL